MLTLQGKGTVVTGRLEQGTIKIGEPVEIVGGKKKTLKAVVQGVRKAIKVLDHCWTTFMVSHLKDALYAVYTKFCFVNGYILMQIEMYHKSLDEAQAGDQVGLLLKGAFKREDLGRTQVEKTSA